MEIPEKNKAYFAALFETSGTFYNDMDEERKYVTISIVAAKQSNNAALREGQKIWGGKLLHDPKNRDQDELLWYEEKWIDCSSDGESGSQSYPRVKAGKIHQKYRPKEMEWKLAGESTEKFLFDVKPHFRFSREKKIASIQEIARFWDRELFRCPYCHKIFDDQNQLCKKTDHFVRVSQL